MKGGAACWPHTLVENGQERLHVGQDLNRVRLPNVEVTLRGGGAGVAGVHAGCHIVLPHTLWMRPPVDIDDIARPMVHCRVAPWASAMVLPLGLQPPAGSGGEVPDSKMLGRDGATAEQGGQDSERGVVSGGVWNGTAAGRGRGRMAAGLARCRRRSQKREFGAWIERNGHVCSRFMALAVLGQSGEGAARGWDGVPSRWFRWEMADGKGGWDLVCLARTWEWERAERMVVETLVSGRDGRRLDEFVVCGAGEAGQREYLCRSSGLARCFDGRSSQWASAASKGPGMRAFGFGNGRRVVRARCA